MAGNKQKVPINTISHKSVMDDKSLMERCKYNYDLVNMWIGNADNKVGVFCGVYSVAFGVITFLSTQYGKLAKQPEINQCWQVLYKAGFVISIIFIAVAIAFYTKAIIPNLKSNNKAPLCKTYPIYYGDIASLGSDNYKKLIQDGKEGDFIEELILETHFNSQICRKKMENFKIGVICSSIALGLAFFCYFAHYMMYQ